MESPERLSIHLPYFRQKMPRGLKREASEYMSQKRSRRQYHKSKRSIYAAKHRYDKQQPTTYGEVKALDFPLANKALNTTGSVTLLNPIPQGNGDSDRDGKSCKVTSIQINGYAVVDTNTTGNLCRYLVIYDKKPSGVLPQVTDILDYSNCNGYVRWDQKHRFMVLRDYRFTLAGSFTAPGTGDIVKPIQGIQDYIKLPKDLKTEWTSSDTTGAIATCTEGAIYLLTTGSIAAGTGDAELFANFRVSFLDC